MKSAGLQLFLAENGGASGCLDALNSQDWDAWAVAQEFTRLVSRNIESSTPTSRKDIIKLCEIPEYKPLLIKAIESFSYGEVENFVLDNLKLRHSQVRNPFIDVFKRPYIGTAANTLYDYLTTLNEDFRKNKGAFHSKQVTIVQSSGMGKSRTMIELKNRGAIVLYINLRSTAENGDPYPERDPIPARILTEALGCTAKEYNYRCSTFFAALFQVMRTHLLELRKTRSERRKIVIAWSQLMCDVDSGFRQHFFGELHTKYLEVITQSKTGSRTETVLEPLTNKRKVGNQVPFVAGSHSGKITPSSSSESSLKDRAAKLSHPRVRGETEMKVAYNELVDDLPEIFDIGSDEPSLIMEFDESHSLRGAGVAFSPARVFSRIISEISEARPEVSVWTLVSSTASQVADFSAPSDVYPSLRVSIGGKLLFQPFSGFNLDPCAPGLDDVKPAEVAQFSHIVKFGRPLWNSLVESHFIPSRVVKTAQQKLCGNASFDPTALQHAIAVMGQRFFLPICLGARNAVDIHSDAVAGHLRLCLCASEDRKTIRSGYSSEPLLSCAAADLVYPLDDPSDPGFYNYLEVALDTVRAAVVDHTIERGLKGELISRFNFLLGKDAAIRKHMLIHPDMMSPITKSGELLDCKSLPLDIYLDVTLGIKLDKETLDSFSGWHVNHSHWVAVNEIISFGETADPKAQMQNWLLCNWIRTSAIQCCHQQLNFDKVIPMYKIEEPLAPSSDLGSATERVSFILISDKARKRPGSVEEVDISLSSGGLPALKHPYIAILADLGLTDQNVTWRVKSSEGGTQLRIHACGLGPTTYPFLNKAMADYLREILELQLPDDRQSSLIKRATNQATWGTSTKESSWQWWKR